MAKWSNAEQWTNTALAVMQAERNGDVAGAEQALKSLSNAYETIGQMRETQYKIATLPIQQRTAEAYMKTAETQEMKVRNEVETAKRKQALLQELSRVTGQPLEVIDEAIKGIEFANKQNAYQTDVAMGLPQARGQAELGELGLKTETNKQLLEKRVPSYQAESKVSEAMTTRDFAYPLESEKLAQEKIKTKYMPEEYESQAWARRHPQSSSSALLPINVANTAQDNISALERQETSLYGALARLDQIYKSGESDVFGQLMSSMPSLQGSIPNVANADRDTQYNTIKQNLMSQLPSVSNNKKYWQSVMTTELGKAGYTPPQTQSAIQGINKEQKGIWQQKNMSFTKEAWDKLPYERQRYYIDNTNPVDPEGKPLSISKQRTTATQSKPATKQEQPQKTGNTNKEKKSVIDEEDKKFFKGIKIK